MKKLFTTMMLGAIVAFTSCQRDTQTTGVVEGTETEVVINAGVDLGTKAHGDAIVNRYIMEVYFTGTNELYKRVSQPTGEFAIRLISGRAYDFVFWADKQTDASELVYTTTNNLKNIEMVQPYVGNNETRDAFFGSIQNVSVVGVTSQEIILRRPFAQINIATGTVDIPTIYLPSFVRLNVADVYTKFNALTGEVSNLVPESIAYWATPVSVSGSYPMQTNITLTNLATDYFFTSTVGHNLDLTISFYKSVDELTKYTERVIVNIPVNRNKRTNIIGEIMTHNSTIEVSVGNSFEDPAIDYPVAD